MVFGNIGRKIYINCGDNILAIEKYPVLEENIKQIYERVHFDKEHKFED